MNKDALELKAMRQTLSVMGEVILIDGVAVDAVVDKVDQTRDRRDGGFMTDIECSAVVVRDDVPVVPRAGKTVLIDGVTMRIESVESDPITFTLGLARLDK